MRVVAALAVFAAAAFMLYGWGWLARRLLRLNSAPWPAAAAAGMAALVFLGGVLNLARLAYPWALDLVAGTGAVLGAVAIWKQRPAKPAWGWLIAPAIVLLFVTVTQVPPQVYNFHDDFQKYFVHPVRMLQTGTVFGSPLNDIGFDTLGGQAFLDGFAVAFFPIQYLNGVGAALALFLCMMLASQYRSVVAAFSVVVIHPQYVNISALYTGSLLMMAAMMEAGESAALTGLFYAALTALKGTFLLFVAVHLAASIWMLGWRRGVRTGAYAALFLSPWILVHLPHYLHLASGGLGISEHGVREPGIFNIFSPAPLDYGATPLAYTGLMIAIGLCGAMLVQIKRMARVKGTVDLTAAACFAPAACFAMVAAYLIMIYVSGPRNAGYEQAVRYFTPFAIAAAPVAFGAAMQAFDGFPDYHWMVLAATAIPLLVFVPSLRDRIQEADRYGTVLAFPWLATTAEYRAYNQAVLYGDMRHRVEAAQTAVPPGEPFIAWINAPFYLDFRRNPVADVEPGAGLIAPWAKLPDAHYVIYEYQGYANMEEADYLEGMAEGPDFMRRVSAARLKMSGLFAAEMQQSPKLYDDGGIAVFRR